jgi:hypothetical protein
MKPYVTAIGIGRGIAIMASELCNGPTLHELVTCLIVINEVADAPVHILEGGEINRDEYLEKKR